MTRPPLNAEIQRFFSCPRNEAEHVAAALVQDDGKLAKIEALIAMLYCDAEEFNPREVIYQIQTMGEAQHEKLYCHCSENVTCDRCRTNAQLRKLGEDVA